MKARLIIDSTRRNADLFYLTRLRAPDPIIWIKTGRERVLILSELELDRARKEARADLVLPANTYYARAVASTGRAATPAHAAAAFLEERRAKRVEVPVDFPLKYYRVLTGLGFDVVMPEGDFVPARRAKSKWEKREIEEAVRRGAEGIDLAVDMIRRAEVRGRTLHLGGAPLTSERLKKDVAGFLLDKDHDAADLILAGRREHTCLPHHTGGGPLGAGEFIIMDFFPRSRRSGYHGDITRTVVKGRAGKRQERMYRAVRKVERAVASMLRPGAECRALHRTALRMLEREGFRTGRRKGSAYGFFHGIGHGLGLEVHERPSFSAAGEVLRRGDVVTVEPGLYYPDVGGVRHENVYMITSSGSELLTHYEIPLELD
jgi:Xaa-Pro aminopeptidase